MLFVLSPAKSLDYETPAGDVDHTLPIFASQAAQLIKLLRAKSPGQIAELMSLSDALASLNVARYKAWRSTFTANNAKPALLAFNGAVYEGLNAKTLKPLELTWAQDHLCILSGLYGVLRPLDWMQPYRLEMGTALVNPLGKTLYKFWDSRIAAHLNARLQSDKSPVLINLASQEYFKAVNTKTLKARVVDCVFEEWHNGSYKVIGVMAKRARGLMARYAIQHRINTPRKLERFDLEGYAFAADASGGDRLVFRRQTGA